MDGHLKIKNNEDIPFYSGENIDKYNDFKSKYQGHKIVITHSGQFHADEVLASVMVKYIPEFNNLAITRTRNTNIIKQGDIVLDVGGIYDPSSHRYDHHQREFQNTFDEENKIRMSSAGLVYKHFGMEVIRNFLKHKLDMDCNDNLLKQVYDRLYLKFIMGVDAIDNGINKYPSNVKPLYSDSTDFGARIGRLNPSWNEENPNIETQFKMAMNVAEEELYYQLKFLAKSFFSAYNIVLEAVENRKYFHESEQIVFLKKACPWKEHLYAIEEKLNIQNKLKFVVYETSDDVRVQTVPLSEGNFEFRKGLLKHWRGLELEKLKEISGIDDIVFVHNSGFIGGAKSLESAIKMATQSLSDE